MEQVRDRKKYVYLAAIFCDWWNLQGRSWSDLKLIDHWMAFLKGQPISYWE